MLPENLTTDRLEWLCHKARVEEFRQSLAELGHGAVSIIFGQLGEKLASIDHQLIHSRAVEDAGWVRRAQQARQILERKQRATRERLDAIRNTSLQALGGLDSLQGSRLAMIKALLGIVDRHLATARLTEEERAAINACQAVSGQTQDSPLGPLTYQPAIHAILRQDRTEVAVVSRHGFDQDEVGETLAASTAMLDQIGRALPFVQSSKEGAALAAEMGTLLGRLR